ncbi:hypothetical protein NC651_036494 [Populus alba x Populus x berolinensis]|nr:hypothetical protein NC651_036494 [Populus alba x Populus x berolinensis]
MLPAGFLDHTSDRGIECLGWAQQPEILAHPAIGGCLLHYGRVSISITESLSYGHPQILMPMVASQGLNAKLLFEKGNGFQVQSNEDGTHNQDSIAMSLRFVIADQEG